MFVASAVARETWRLGIDYGTSTTVAMLSWPGGRTRPLLFDGSPLLSSAVYLTTDGKVLTGRDAERNARLDPARFEPNPKRRIDDGDLFLGERPVPVVEAIAATLRRVREEATRTAGALPAGVTVTYPAAWGGPRRGILAEAVSRAGLPTPALVPEPIAAAVYFATVLGHRIGPGEVVMVYDLGAGTLDVSAVRRTATGFEVLAFDGIGDFGGLDLDTIIVGRAGVTIEPATWQRLTAPATAADRRHFRMLWDDARAAKETLSRQPSVDLHVPLADRDVVIGREEFETAARPALQRAAALTMGLVQQVGAARDRLAGLFLVGGSTRVPLVATSLHQATGIAPTVLEQPEIVVAEGALHATAPPEPATPARVPAAPPALPPVPWSGYPPAPLSPAPAPSQAVPQQRRENRRLVILLTISIIGIYVAPVIAVALVYLFGVNDGPWGGILAVAFEVGFITLLVWAIVTQVRRNRRAKQRNPSLPRF